MLTYLTHPLFVNKPIKAKQPLITIRSHLVHFRDSPGTRLYLQ